MDDAGVCRCGSAAPPHTGETPLGLKVGTAAAAETEPPPIQEIAGEAWEF